MDDKVVNGMTAVEALRVASQRVESLLRVNQRGQADTLQAITKAHTELERLEAQQRELLGELEGLRIAGPRLAIQDADLLARFTGPETSVD